MVLKYSWLKILDILKKRGAKLTVADLQRELDARGFHIPGEELAEDLPRLRELGLIEADVLVSTDGTTTAPLDEFSGIGITAAGLRKLTGIVKI